MIFNTAMLTVLSIIFSFVLSMILVRISITLLPLLGLLDQPGGRHIHTKPTPKGGGLAFILAFFITGVFFNLSQNIILPGTMDLAFMGKIALPVVLLTVIGFLDDRYDIHAVWKLLGHITVGVLSWILGIQLNTIFGIPLSDTVSLILTVLWFVGFINAFNLIDGMDGLAAGLAIVVSVTLAIMFAGCPYYGDNTEGRLFDDGLCLPSGPTLTHADINRVVDVIKGMF